MVCGWFFICGCQIYKRQCWIILVVGILFQFLSFPTLQFLKNKNWSITNRDQEKYEKYQQRWKKRSKNRIQIKMSYYIIFDCLFLRICLLLVGVCYFLYCSPFWIYSWQEQDDNKKGYRGEKTDQEYFNNIRMKIIKRRHYIVEEQVCLIKIIYTFCKCAGENEISTKINTNKYKLGFPLKQELIYQIFDRRE